MRTARQDTEDQEPNPLLDFRWGLERETHRILRDGTLSGTDHPEVLGKPAFTRDFAEGQLEIVTPPLSSIPQTVAELEALTEVARQILEPELLWPFSMPPALPQESAIPIARFPSDPRATLYRQGLALRYGKARQMICGVHLNVSFGAALTSVLAREYPLTAEEAANGGAGYLLRLTRNLYRDLPLFVLLFGASPVRGGNTAADEPFAVSYRNSRFGYARGEFIPYLDLTSFEAYLEGIRRGLHTESAEFAPLGLVREGSVIQLNGNVFQADKEFYAPIRLRQAPLAGESSLQALSRRGAGYLELRFLDVDPFSPAGIGEDTLRLLHLFLLDDLARPSEPRTNASLREDLRAAAETALLDPLDSKPNTMLGILADRLAGLASWARRADATGEYSRCLERFQSKVSDPRRLPSAALAQSFLATGYSWTTFGAHLSLLSGAEHALEHTRV